MSLFNSLTISHFRNRTQQFYVFGHRAISHHFLYLPTIAASTLFVLTSNLQPHVKSPLSQQCRRLNEVFVSFHRVETPTTIDSTRAVWFPRDIWTLTLHFIKIDTHGSNNDLVGQEIGKSFLNNSKKQ